MTLPLWTTDGPDFRRRLSALLDGWRSAEAPAAAGEAGKPSPQEAVRAIVQDVRARGDDALLEYTERFDRCRLTADRLRVTAEEVEAAVARCPKELTEALRLAADRIRAFQEATLVRDPAPLVDGGRRLALRYRPVDSAGVYVPGGTAPLASTVLMAAIPAKVAGVPRVAMATPPLPDGSVSDDRLAAAAIAGVDEIYRMGGAQAIAALAFGTASVPNVDFIAGPGNIYVTLAKKEVFGRVGIDMLSGPSEVIIIADATAQADLLAADMLAQAEHNPGSSILLTDNADLAGRVREAVEAQLAELSRQEAARSCLERYGAVIVCRSMDECVELANELAPEHLEIVTRDPAAVADGIRHAGAIFLGPWTPVAVGDYVAGPSHVLPTMGTARFCGGLSANDFRKRSSLIEYDRPSLAEDAAALDAMARAEGLDAHARSVELRRADETAD